MTTFITAHDFNRDVSAAKRAAEQDPVTVTDHGRPSHVSLSAADFDKLARQQELMGDRLWRNRDPTIGLELRERHIEIPRTVNL